MSGGLFSNCIVVGNNRRTRALPFLLTLRSDEISDKSKELFTKIENHLDAVSTILGQVANKVNFHPGSGDVRTDADRNKLTQSFYRFIETVDHVPFLNSPSSNQRINRSINKRDYNEITRSLLAVFDSFDDKSLLKIKEGISNLAKAVLTSQTKELHASSFAQFYVDARDKNQLKFGFAYTTIDLTQQEGKHQIKENQAYSVNISEYTVNHSAIIAHADKLALMDAKNFDDFQKWLTSPYDPNMKTCLDK